MIYLDSAATTLYRPREVTAAVRRAFSLGNPGRGGHQVSLAAARELFSVREKIASHFGSDLPDGVCFFYNATTALNVAVKMLVPPGGRLLLSTMEHNALRRPALALEKAGVKVDFFKGYGSKKEILSSFSDALKPRPDLVAFIHHSNICPQTLPLSDLCAAARRARVLTLVDCAQSAGHVPLSLNKSGADAFVVPSHKGLLGIPGAAALVCSPSMKSALENAPTLLEGGSGVLSFEPGMPAALPERLECGTPALPAIASLGAGISYLESLGYDEISSRLSSLCARAVDGISAIPSLKLYGVKGSPAPDGPLLFVSKSVEHSHLAARLDAAGVCLREGFHCAPFAHQSIGTARSGGLRVSFSVFNTPRQIDRFLSILRNAVT